VVSRPPGIRASLALELLPRRQVRSLSLTRRSLMAMPLFRIAAWVRKNCIAYLSLLVIEKCLCPRDVHIGWNNCHGGPTTFPPLMMICEVALPLTVTSSTGTLHSQKRLLLMLKIPTVPEGADI
jgi:hypothetical protein